MLLLWQHLRQCWQLHYKKSDRCLAVPIATNKHDMERLEELKRLFEANTLNDEDKAFIRELCKEFHLLFEPRTTRCQNCYKDQIILIMNEIKKKQAQKTDCKWSVVEPHGSVGLIINGELVNNSTINNGLAKRVIAAGFGKYLYENNA